MARRLEAHIEAASTELKLRKRTLDQAEQAAVVRTQLKTDIKDEEAALKETGQRLSGVHEQEKQDRSRVDALRAKVRQSEAAVTQADEAVSRCRRVLGTVELQARLRDLEGRCEKAQAADKRRREAQQAAAAILVTDQAIMAIHKAAKGLQAVQGRLNAAATLISFDMTHDGLSGIKVNGDPVTDDRLSVQAVEPVTITVPDRGRITVAPAIAGREELLRRQRNAKTSLKEALAVASVKSVADADDQYAKRQKLLRDGDLASQEAELYAPATDDYEAGAQALADYIEGLRQVLRREMNELDLQDLPVRQEAETTCRAAQGQAVEARNALNTARAALSGPEDTLSTLQREIGPLQGRYDESKDRLEKLQNRVAQEEEALSDNQLQSAIKAARAARSEQETAIASLEAQRTDETLPQLTARIERLERALEERRKKSTKLKVSIAGLKSSVEAAEGAGLDEAIAQKARDLEIMEEAKGRQDREVRVLGLLLSTLRVAEQAAKEQYLSPVLSRVRPYLQVLFPGADIHLDENLHITGMVREAGYEEAFSRLSMGTQEQIAVLVRLAFAEMLVEQGRPATVVLDDALVFSRRPADGPHFRHPQHGGPKRPGGCFHLPGATLRESWRPAVIA